MKLRNDMKILWVLSRDRYIVIRPSSISEKGVAICARVGSTVDLINIHGKARSRSSVNGSNVQVSSLDSSAWN